MLGPEAANAILGEAVETANDDLLAGLFAYVTARYAARP
jgi:hypothetical protein